MIIMCLGIGVDNSCLLLVHVHDILFFFFFFFLRSTVLRRVAPLPNYHPNAAQDQVNG